jgi:hypothetical protein
MYQLLHPISSNHVHANFLVYMQMRVQVAPVKLRGRRGSHLPAQHITMLCFDAASAEGALRSTMEFSSTGSVITLVCK